MFWYYYRDEPDATFANSETFKFQVKIAGKTPAGGNTMDVKVAVPLKYLGKF